jgi:hypothetical protein
MAIQFGHGFIMNIMLIAKHFRLLPEPAWSVAGNPVVGHVLPEKFRKTGVEDLKTLLRRKMIRHQPGTMDRENDVIFILNRLVVAIDRETGIKDADTGEFG